METKLLWLCVLILAFSLFIDKAYSKVMPYIHDGGCIPISSKYFHQNPDKDMYDILVEDTKSDVEKQQGFIPPNTKTDDRDIAACYVEVKDWDRT